MNINLIGHIIQSVILSLFILGLYWIFLKRFTEKRLESEVLNKNHNLFKTSKILTNKYFLGISSIMVFLIPFITFLLLVHLT